MESKQHKLNKILKIPQMSEWRSFCVQPSFEIDYGFPEPVPYELQTYWNRNMDPVYISHIEPAERSLRAKAQWVLFHEYNDPKFPIVFMVLAESCFWLDDVHGCHDYLVLLKNSIPHNSKLERITGFILEFLKDSVDNDDAYHSGQDFKGARVLEFKTPYGCPRVHPNEHRLGLYLNAWTEFQTTSTVEHLYRYACIATNELERVFELGHRWSSSLIRYGFCVDSADFPSRKNDGPRVVRILENTLSATHAGMISDPEEFTPEFIKSVHRILLANDNFEEYEVEDGGHVYTEYKKIDSGRFRRVACLTTDDDETRVVQYCHHSLIDDEIEFYCERVRRLLREDVDVFVKAAWIQWAFLRIHPFGDGNGHVSRIISSIPLVLVGLPPVIVGPQDRNEYFECLHTAEQDSDVLPLSKFLTKTLSLAIQTVSLLNWSIEEILLINRKYDSGL
jgi:hypothetical protein